MLDGHKFGCGLHHIVSTPIVYSLGSNRQQDFEEGIRDIRPDSQMFVYELFAKNLPDEKLPNTSYFAIGLGYPKSENNDFKSLAQMMKDHQHTYIDVLKMDIEGYEWEFIKMESDILPRIGQILFEVHLSREHPSVLPMVEVFEKAGLRMYHRELNKLTKNHCEYSLIQSEWTMWNTVKKFSFTND